MATTLANALISIHESHNHTKTKKVVYTHGTGNVSKILHH